MKFTEEQITAYALGELDESTAKAIETALGSGQNEIIFCNEKGEDSVMIVAELRDQIEEIRATSLILSNALAEEPAHAFADTEADELERDTSADADGWTSPMVKRIKQNEPSRMKKRNVMYYLAAGGAMAACISVVMTVSSLNKTETQTVAERGAVIEDAVVAPAGADQQQVGAQVAEAVMEVALVESRTLDNLRIDSSAEGLEPLELSAASQPALAYAIDEMEALPALGLGADLVSDESKAGHGRAGGPLAKDADVSRKRTKGLKESESTFALAELDGSAAATASADHYAYAPPHATKRTAVAGQTPKPAAVPAQLGDVLSTNHDFATVAESPASQFRSSLGREAHSMSIKPDSAWHYRDGLTRDHGFAWRERQRHYEPRSNEGYSQTLDNPFKRVADEALSTFSTDVDTASYANMRRMLTNGQLPPRDAIRIEELVNYFPYDYAPPRDREQPFAVHVEAAPAPWKPEHNLVRIGLKGYEVEWSERPASNLVFLIDKSGSMRPENKLPLVKQSLKMLVDRLDRRDRVAIVTYASGSGVALPSTTANNRETIYHAIDILGAGGSTAGAAGIRDAYAIARRNFIEGANNRVILCTDGDFNVGTTDNDELTRMIEAEAKSGVYLSIFGFGMGNLKDDRLEQLSNKGNGNYGYIDSEREARKNFIEGAAGTLLTIAKDVKIQVEFNPANVQAYRLIGYANRLLNKEDFNDDTKDAGEIGAGHTVTAFYEVVPAGIAFTAAPGVDPLKYQSTVTVEKPAPSKGNPEFNDEMLTVKLRYKLPEEDTSTLIRVPMKVRDLRESFGEASSDFRFSSSVAAFGMILRGSQYAGGADFEWVLNVAEGAQGDNRGGHRSDFLHLVRKAQELMRDRYPPPVEPEHGCGGDCRHPHPPKPEPYTR